MKHLASLLLAILPLIGNTQTHQVNKKDVHVWNYDFDKSDPKSAKAFVAAKDELGFNAPNTNSVAQITIFISDDKNEVGLSISKGEFKADADGFVYPKIRFDNSSVISVKCFLSKDETKVYFFKPDSILNRLKKAKITLIEARFYDGQKRVMEFNTDKLKWSHETKVSDQTGGPLADSLSYGWRNGDEVDKMSSDTVYVVSAYSTNQLNLKYPYDGGITAQMVLVYNTDGLNYLSVKLPKGQFLFDIHQKMYVRLRFDNDKDVSAECFQAGMDSKTIWFKDPASIMSMLKKAQKVLVEADFFNDGTKIMEFNPGQLVWNHVDKKRR